MTTQLTATGKGKSFNFDATVLEMDERSFDSRSSGSGPKPQEEEEEEQKFPTLTEVVDLHAKFDINQTSTLTQRFTNILWQPMKIDDLEPVRIQFLTQRARRCKKCTKQLIKLNLSPQAEKALVMDDLMAKFIPKVTIYRIGTLKPNATPVVDFMLKFANPN